MAPLNCLTSFNGRLASITTDGQALFLADALAETNHYLDNVWTSGRKERKGWYWEGILKYADEQLLGKYYIRRENEEEYNTTRQCLAFRRNHHNQPRFLSLSCKLARPSICERKSK